VKNKANTSRIIKQANELLVLHALHENDELTVEDIMSITKLSRPTTLSLLKELHAQGLMEKAGLGESMGGRQPFLYKLDLTNYFAVGIDFEFPPIRLIISDLKEQIVYHKNWVSRRDISIPELEKDIADAVYEGLHKLSIGPDNILGIAFGIPGRVDVSKNKATAINRLQQWKSEDLVGFLAEEFKVPVIARNDIHLIAITEHRLQPSKPKTFIFIVRRKGIGGAVFIDGESYEGERGNSAFIGHVVVDPNGPDCHCGKKGCLELYAGIDGIEDVYAGRMALEEHVPYSQILESAKKGDAQAQYVISSATERLATVVASSVQMLDIGTVIFADEDHDESDYFFRLFASKLQDLVSQAEDTRLQILKGVSTQEIYALGGCISVLNTLFDAPELIVNLKT